MKLQIATLAVPFALAASLMIPVAANAQNVPHRLHHQERRINQGVRSGALTRGETHRLRTRDASIRGAEFHDRMHDRRTGGVLTKAQDARLDHRLNRTSKAIYKLKHNKNVAA